VFLYTKSPVLLKTGLFNWTLMCSGLSTSKIDSDDICFADITKSAKLFVAQIWQDSAVFKSHNFCGVYSLIGSSTVPDIGSRYQRVIGS